MLPSASESYLDRLMEKADVALLEDGCVAIVLIGE